MKSKQVKIVASVTILLMLVVCTYNNFTNKNEEIVLNNEVETKTGTAALSMMYETEAGSGNYVECNESTWPGEGYTFNETLSKCEQGGILTWDDEKKVVNLSTNKSDKCYVYFDVSRKIIIESADVSLSCGLSNYIKNVVTNENVDVQKYVLILDNGAQLEATESVNQWRCINSESRCFDLKTMYNYELYLITTDGKKSESYFGSLETDAEVC